jgi:hypothetical protein
MDGVDEKLPAGWIKVKSKSRHDKYYFYNAKKKISVWSMSDINKQHLPSNNIRGSSKTPEKNSSGKSTSIIINNNSKIVKKNMAKERMKKLQETLKDELKRAEEDKSEVLEKKKSMEIVKVSPKKSTKVPYTLKEDIKNVRKASFADVAENKKNLAAGRLQKLQQKFKTDNKNKPSENVNKTNDNNNTGKRLEKNETTCNTSNNKRRKLTNELESKITVAPVTVQKSSNDINYNAVPMDWSEDVEMEELPSNNEAKLCEVEAMEWEEIDEKFVIQEINYVRNKSDNKLSSSINSQTSHNNVRFANDTFYIIVDTNVFLSNLSFVKKVKGKAFKGKN